MSSEFNKQLATIRKNNKELETLLKEIEKRNKPSIVDALNRIAIALEERNLILKGEVRNTEAVIERTTMNAKIIKANKDEIAKKI